MPPYVIAVTATHDAVDYAFYSRLAVRHKFHFFVTRGDAVRKNMTFIPMAECTALDLHDVIYQMKQNSPGLITYELQA